MIPIVKIEGNSVITDLINDTDSYDRRKAECHISITDLVNDSPGIYISHHSSYSQDSSSGMHNILKNVTAKVLTSLL